MMIKPNNLRYLNLFLLLLLVSVASASTLSWLTVDNSDIIALETTQNKQDSIFLPHSFAQKEPSLTEPFFQISKNSPALRIPDLRALVMYYGSNHRPDVEGIGSLVNIGFRGLQESKQVMPHTPVYLVYNPKPGTSRWSFSPNNEPTTIWLEVAPKDNGAEFCVLMQIDDGEIITEPEECAFFTVNQIHMPAGFRMGNTWEINGLRVDSSLLLRQKAVWFGPDLFLQQFGGKEYEELAFKERIDFLNPENNYSIFIGKGDCLIFSENRWVVVEPGEESRGKPLLVVKKIDDRSIGFDLWDEEGKNKVSLELHKAMNAAMNTQSLTAKLDMKLIGAKTKQDWIVSLSGTRMLLRDDDWLLASQGKWEKITSSQMLDDYIVGKKKGVLLVLDGTEKEGNNVRLKGVLFDETRTRSQPIQIALYKSVEKSQKSLPAKTPGKYPDDDDDDDDDDFDDDDFDEDDFDDFDDDDDDEDF